MSIINAVARDNSVKVPLLKGDLGACWNKATSNEKDDRFLLAASSAPHLIGESSPLDAARAAVADYEKEHAAAEQARATDPQAASQADARARIHINEAIALFESAGAATDGDEAAVLEYVAALEAADYFDLAAETLEKAIERTPEDAALWLRLGQNRVRMGPAGEQAGLDALLRSLALDDTNAETRFALGDRYLKLGLYESAGAHIDAALEHDPNHLWALVDRAALDVRAGKIVEASQALDALGKSIQPIDPEVRVLLRAALAGYEEGAPWLEDTAENHKAYGRLLYRAGRLPDAALALRRGLELAPNDVGNWNFLGTIHMQTGNLPGAIDAYEQSLVHNPAQPDVQRTVADMKAELTRQRAAAPTAPSATTQPATPRPPGPYAN